MPAVGSTSQRAHNRKGHFNDFNDKMAICKANFGWSINSCISMFKQKIMKALIIFAIKEKKHILISLV